MNRRWRTIKKLRAGGLCGAKRAGGLRFVRDDLCCLHAVFFHCWGGKSLGKRQTQGAGGGEFDVPGDLGLMGRTGDILVQFALGMDEGFDGSGICRAGFRFVVAGEVGERLADFCRGVCGIADLVGFHSTDA